MSDKDLITLIIAAYAAVLSTINFYLQRRDKQGRLQVTLTKGLGFSQSAVSDPLLILTARNRADRPVVVTIPGFMLPTGQHMIYLTPHSDVSFPFELKPERD